MINVIGNKEAQAYGASDGETTVLATKVLGTTAAEAATVPSAGGMPAVGGGNVVARPCTTNVRKEDVRI